MKGLESTAFGLALALSLSGAPCAHAASYRGHNVDRHHYHATLTNYDFGSFEDADVRFQGEHAYAHLVNGARLVLVLEEEDIDDPHEIVAHDPRRGITWLLDVKDLVAR